MAKLKEVDRRPKRQFQPGDIVRYNRGKDGFTGEGVVLQTEPHCKNHGYQKCWCVFSAREVDLYTAARDFINKKTQNSAYTKGAVIMNTALSYERSAPESWFKAITPAEICTLRFIQILDEE